MPSSPPGQKPAQNTGVLRVQSMWSRRTSCHFYNLKHHHSGHVGQWFPPRLALDVSSTKLREAFFQKCPAPCCIRPIPAVAVAQPYQLGKLKKKQNEKWKIMMRFDSWLNFSSPMRVREQGSSLGQDWTWSRSSLWSDTPTINTSCYISFSMASYVNALRSGTSVVYNL